jgi:adenylate kinase family enzyme
VQPARFMINVQCTSEAMTERLLKRGRFDDDVDTIWRRLLRFEKETMPVLRRFMHDSRKFVVSVDGYDAREVNTCEHQVPQSA